ncbi:MAG: exodeoxyribonuclease VII large subunit [Ignavibacteriaceae bacterium]|jgi:exodeoxyribonuclease VII large subunit
MEILTVSELTNKIKFTLEDNFSQINIVGEISNFKAHVSGHWYFNLKDSNAVINCTMWKGLNSYVFFTPQDGMKIIVSGRITVYPPRGNYQFDVKSMKPAGIGELQAAFELLKQKLAAEGLFQEQYKKQIPVFPQKIGIVTAIDGAAFKDMISVAKRRFPLVELVIASSQVQGSGAAETIAESIRMLNERTDIDVIIVGRGGGSIEDLWAFNEEIVAREIFKSRIPVITGIGHEIDFTIADFVADVRASTPSAAMEIATPNKEDLFSLINDFSFGSSQNLSRIMTESKSKVSNFINSYGFRIPMDIVRRKSQETDNLTYRLVQNIDRKLLLTGNKLSLLSQQIEAHNIQKSLKKGFVLVKQNSKFVTRSVNFDKNKESVLKFYDSDVIVNNKVT